MTVKKSKPFPRFCPTCRRQEVVPETISYASDSAHEGVLYHLHFPRTSENSRPLNSAGKVPGLPA